LTLHDLAMLEPGTSRDDIVTSLEELREHYRETAHGVELMEVAGGYQLLSRPEFAEAIAEARIVTRPRKLSAAALETLAVIAYRQPVGRPEIEEVRGVSVESVLRSLQERGLIDVVGRAEGMGRPLLYATTTTFLELLGLPSLDALPRLEELSVALRPLAEMGEP
jgi:segregation and condensation protein B